MQSAPLLVRPLPPLSLEEDQTPVLALKAPRELFQPSPGLTQCHQPQPFREHIPVGDMLFLQPESSGEIQVSLLQTTDVLWLSPLPRRDTLPQPWLSTH